MEKKRLVLAMVFGVFVLVACATTGVEVLPGDIEKGIAVEKPVWNLGDTWTYKIVTVKSGEKKEIVRKRIVKEIVEEKGKMYYVVSEAQGKVNTCFDVNLNIKYGKDASGKIILHNMPSSLTFNWPLKVGKKWWGRFSWEPLGPDDPPYLDVTVEVVARESVVVMGKEITTFKLVERRYNPRGICLAEITWWYSPEIKNLVKWIDDRWYYQTGELINFSLAH